MIKLHMLTKCGQVMKTEVVGVWLILSLTWELQLSLLNTRNEFLSPKFITVKFNLTSRTKLFCLSFFYLFVLSFDNVTLLSDSFYLFYNLLQYKYQIPTSFFPDFFYRIRTKCCLWHFYYRWLTIYECLLTINHTQII